MTALALVAEDIDPVCESWLRERADVLRVAHDDPAFDGALARANALIVRTYTIVNDALLDKAPRLRVVARAGVGLDNINLHACAKRNIPVVYTPDANSAAVTELVFALLLDQLRPRTRLTKALPPMEWKALRASVIAPRQLADLTLGILGLGRVGRSVARVATAFRMRVLYHDLLDIPEGRRAGAEPVPRDSLLRDSDVLSIHVDERESNRNLIGAPELSVMKPDAILVNAARGFVLDPCALARHMQARGDFRAILDVHEPEPPNNDYPLFHVERATLTPHIGAATSTAHRNMSWVVRDVWRVLNGEPPEFPAGPRP